MYYPLHFHKEIYEVNISTLDYKNFAFDLFNFVYIFCPFQSSQMNYKISVNLNLLAVLGYQNIAFSEHKTERNCS